MKQAGPISKTNKQQLLATMEGMTAFTTEVKTLIADMDGMGSGSLGPDQVKQILQGVASNMTAISQKLTEAINGIPSSEGGDGGEGAGEGTPEPQEGKGAGQQAAAQSDVGLEQGHEHPAERTTASDKKPYNGKESSNTNDQLAEFVASEVNKVIAAKEAKDRVANAFAALVPAYMRQAKYDEIMASTEPLNILQAKLEGMKMASSNQVKTASNKKISLNPKKYPLFAAEGVGQREASMGTEEGKVIVI